MQRGHSRGSSIDEANIENVPPSPRVCLYVDRIDWTSARTYLIYVRRRKKRRGPPSILRRRRRRKEIG